MQSVRSQKRERDDSLPSESGNEARSDEGAASQVPTTREETAEETNKRQRTEELEDAIDVNDRLKANSSDSKIRLPSQKSSWFTLGWNPPRQALTADESSAQVTGSPEPTSIMDPPETSISPSAPIPISTRQEKEGVSGPGWFGSLSKAQARSLSEPGTWRGQEEDASADKQSKISDIPSSKSIWFAPQSPPPPVPVRTSSVPSTLDDNASTRVGSPAPGLPAREIISTQMSEVNLSALNPSKSRFTLSMPLLGRPKVPLDKALLKVDEVKTSAADTAPSAPGA